MNMTITVTYFKAGTYEKEEITFKGPAHDAYQELSDWRFAHPHTRIYHMNTELE